MTAKRFTYDSKTVSILKDGEFWLDGNVDTACNHSEICEELNNLHEENQELKQLIHTMLMQIDAENIGDENARYSARIIFAKKDFKLLKEIWND